MRIGMTTVFHPQQMRIGSTTGMTSISTCIGRFVNPTRLSKGIRDEDTLNTYAFDEDRYAPSEQSSAIRPRML